MTHRKDRGRPQENEHRRAKGPPFRRPEARRDRDGCAAKSKETDHAPVEFLEPWHAVETIIDAGDKTARDQPHYPDIVAGVSDAGYERRVVVDRVVQRAHPQAERGAGEEAAERSNVGVACSVIAIRERPVEEVCGRRGEEGGEEMAVDVHGLVVDVRQRVEGLSERRRRWSIA